MGKSVRNGGWVDSGMWRAVFGPKRQPGVEPGAVVRRRRAGLAGTGRWKARRIVGSRAAAQRLINLESDAQSQLLCQPAPGLKHPKDTPDRIHPRIPI